MSAITKRNARLADLELSVASFVGEHGAAGERALARSLALDPVAVGGALAALRRAGFLERHRVLAGSPELYSLTGAGWRACGFAPPHAPGPTAASFAHSAAVADAAAALGLRGWDVLGERRYRLIERTTGELMGSVELGPRLHRPDLLLVGGGRAWAVEVELSTKAPRRLEQICRAFARARHLDGAVYFALPGPARAVERAAGAVDAGDVVQVMALEESEHFSPGPA